MKKLHFIFLMMLSIAFVSCGNDDDVADFTLTNANLAGTYSFDYFRTNDTYTYTFNGNTITENDLLEGDMFDVTWNFNADGTYMTSGQFRGTYTYTEDGETIIESETLPFNLTGTYVLNEVNDTLLLNIVQDGGTENTLFTIVNFDRNTLQLRGEENYTDEDESGTEVIEIGLIR